MKREGRERAGEKTERGFHGRKPAAGRREQRTESYGFRLVPSTKRSCRAALRYRYS